MSVNRTIKRLTAILTCVAGILLLLIVGATHDLVIRTLAAISGACLIVSGGIQFWMLRKRRRKAWGDEIPY
jgi:Flp pilus assembly protein TadB